jgi:hypothetical protein
VEIQVRTVLQDLWAQLVEKMADLWGRAIRYGDPPNQPDAPVGQTTRRGLVELVLEGSGVIADLEQAEAEVVQASGDEGLSLWWLPADSVSQEERAAYYKQLREQLEQARKGSRSAMEELLRVLEG